MIRTSHRLINVLEPKISTKNKTSTLICERSAINAMQRDMRSVKYKTQENKLRCNQKLTTLMLEKRTRVARLTTPSRHSMRAICAAPNCSAKIMIHKSGTSIAQTSSKPRATAVTTSLPVPKCSASNYQRPTTQSLATQHKLFSKAQAGHSAPNDTLSPHFTRDWFVCFLIN